MLGRLHVDLTRLENDIMNEKIQNIKDWLSGLSDEQLDYEKEKCIMSGDDEGEDMVYAEIGRRASYKK